MTLNGLIAHPATPTHGAAMSRALSFDVPGEPIPKARPRVGKHGTITPKATRAYQRSVMIRALAARQAHAVARGAWPMAGTYRLEVDYARSTERRHDVDNILKSVMDGLCGVLFDDDCRVTEAEVRRLPGAPVGATVRLFVLSEPAPVVVAPRPARRPSALAHPWKSKAVIPKVQP